MRTINPINPSNPNYPKSALRSAAIYLRISLDVLTTRAGVRRQEEDCRSWAEQHGATVAGVYTDNDISAYSGKRRPGYVRLCEDVEAGAIDGIIVWHLDRLHRRPAELEDFIALVERHRVQVVTVTGGDYDLSTSDGRAMARVIGAFARKECEDKSRRLSRQKQQAAVEGQSHKGGVRPFGYSKTRLQVIPEEAVVIRQMARWVLAGKSLHSVARVLNERGVATASGHGVWSASVVRRMLTSPRRSGQIGYRGEIVAKGDSPAILSVQQTARLRSILLTPTRRVTSERRGYPLTGLLRCGICGSNLIGRPNHGTRSYACFPRAGRSIPCGRISVIAEPLEQLVARQALASEPAPGTLRRQWPYVTAPRLKRLLAGLIESITIQPARMPVCAFDPSRVEIILGPDMTVAPSRPSSG